MKDNSNYEIIENDAELEKLCTDSVELINYARNIVVKHVNIVQIMTYYSLGRWNVFTQQMGEKRAKYGSKVIKTLSENLKRSFDGLEIGPCIPSNMDGFTATRKYRNAVYYITVKYPNHVEEVMG